MSLSARIRSSGRNLITSSALEDPGVGKLTTVENEKNISAGIDECRYCWVGSTGPEYECRHIRGGNDLEVSSMYSCSSTSSLTYSSPGLCCRFISRLLRTFLSCPFQVS